VGNQLAVCPQLNRVCSAALRSAHRNHESAEGHLTMQNPEVQLLPVSREHKEALSESRERLSAVLGLRVPDGWPQFPEAFDPKGHREATEWPGYLFISAIHRSVVGNGGFVDPPVDGQVEIGYEIAPEFRNQGFATRAVLALLRKAFSNQSVQSVVAHTLAERNASNAVLKSVGMTFVTELANEEVGKVWRWHIQRPEGNGVVAEA
jgi:RimJ/RimL family protein N-acetyltransferase